MTFGSGNQVANDFTAADSQGSDPASGVINAWSSAKRTLLLVSLGPCREDLIPRILVAGWQLRTATSLDEAHLYFQKHDFTAGIVVFDDADNLDMQSIEALTVSRTMEWIAVCPPAALKIPVIGRLLTQHFFDFHTTPLDLDRLFATIGHAYGKAVLKRSLLNYRPEEVGRFDMVGRSPPMLECYRRIDRIARADGPVLIGGESGTGKELAARAIHRHSMRGKAPFIAVNCGGMPATLIQSEMFGHEKGAFTGAYQRKIGSIEAAAPGVIFLDEIGDLPHELQATLLRFLEQKSVVRVGSTQPVNVNVRVIAATHVNLEKAVAAGTFREDLYYRLSVLRLDLPPLRERGGDIGVIAKSLFQQMATERNLPVQGFTIDALQAMSQHDWPGNVRELHNRVHQAIVMTDNRLLTAADLGLSRLTQTEKQTLGKARAGIEREVIARTLLANNQNVTESARQLGVSRVTLHRLMNKFEIRQKYIQ